MGFLKNGMDNFKDPYATGGMLMDVASGAMKSIAQGKFYGSQENAATTNAALARLQSQDALDRGKQQGALYARAFDQNYGQKYGSIVGSGVDPTVGSALGGLMDYQKGGALDMATIRNNAAKEAFGFDQQANQYDLEAEQAKIKQRVAAGSGLLTGGMRFLNFGLKNADSGGI